MKNSIEQPVITVRSLRHLDALVAEVLFSIPVEWKDDRPFHNRGLGLEPVRFYHEWPGLEPVVRNREEAGFRWEIGGFSGESWATIWPKNSVMFDGVPTFTTEHESPAVAFCLAALASAGCRVRLELGEL